MDPIPKLLCIALLEEVDIGSYRCWGGDRLPEARGCAVRSTESSAGGCKYQKVAEVIENRAELHKVVAEVPGRHPLRAGPEPFLAERARGTEICTSPSQTAGQLLRRAGCIGYEGVDLGGAAGGWC